ncbi:M1 family metallopeptidase [candidate division KSB1 bacterium]|nr:M1 family metallopeptidase [candidate division KSB1 bacterium]NIR70680.1 M1 family metallopeptidase [candidate division KSB1 bacterium]NIS26032.1 M1 family metallopeptidase [candidate division KSB1 bacterium]NIT72856.1 M1 family metallopeptidase [candidate division KSB1 bacterium]NIU26697.1 M1 family metallopeptidase [candidate division KSB1 bacterium]
MQKMAEPEKVRRFLREEMHRYLIWRARQVVDEPPLIQATSQAYLNYSKGTVVMYALQDYIGEETVNLALRRLAEKYGFQGAPYPTTRDLVRELRAVTPDSLQFVITDLFETITLYENKALEANAAKLPNGKFEVELKVGSRKFRADGKGNETEIDILDYIDIGLFDENGEVLYLGKHRIDRNQMTFKIVVGNKPSEAGIDPYVKLIDKKRENNRTAVSSLHDDSQTLSQR